MSEGGREEGRGGGREEGREGGEGRGGRRNGREEEREINKVPFHSVNSHPNPFYSVHFNLNVGHCSPSVL